MVLVFKFWSIIYFELIFVYDLSKGSCFILLYAATQLFLDHWCIFLTKLTWHSCHKSIDHICKALFLDSSNLFHWSMCLSLCHHHTIFITVAFLVSFEIPQVLFCFLLFRITHIFLVTKFQFSLFNILQTGLSVPLLTIYWFRILIVCCLCCCPVSPPAPHPPPKASKLVLDINSFSHFCLFICCTWHYIGIRDIITNKSDMICSLVDFTF